MKKQGVDNLAFEPSSPERAGSHQQSPPPPPSAASAFANPSPSFEPGEELCGFGGFTPRALQICNNAKGYLVFYSLLSIFQGEPPRRRRGGGESDRDLREGKNKIQITVQSPTPFPASIS